MFLFIGLGNPGPRYAGNRHNIGFMALERIAQRHSFSPWRSKFDGYVAEGRLGPSKCLLLRPETYMNESGRAAMAAVRMHKIELDRIVVFYDELDLAPGKLRVRLGGGAAGHNGIRSLVSRIGAGFRRVRMGIGHPGDKNRVTGWVLGDFARDDSAWLGPFLDAVGRHAPLLAADPPGGQDTDFMSKVAMDSPAPSPPPIPNFTANA